MEAAVADGDEGGGDVTKAIGMELWLWWHVACGNWQWKGYRWREGCSQSAFEDW